MKTVALPSGERVPAFGIGTWHMGERRASRAAEIAAIRRALDLGACLIDTAEMYSEGNAEALVGEAVRGRRDEAFLVSKIYPHNASRRGTLAACERSLRRLGTDRIDLYLLHWRGAEPLADTIAAFQALQAAGKIRHYGVSNFDHHDMEALRSLGAGCEIQTNQLLYNLMRRGIEWDLLPHLRARRIPVMAYSPVEQGRLLGSRALVAFARRYDITPAHAALAWLLKDDDIIAIPKSADPERVAENFRALAIRFDREQLDELDSVFPPPHGPRPLAML